MVSLYIVMGHSIPDEPHPGESEELPQESYLSITPCQGEERENDTEAAEHTQLVNTIASLKSSLAFAE